MCCVTEISREEGERGVLKRNPYGEWFLLRIGMLSRMPMKCICRPILLQTNSLEFSHADVIFPLFAYRWSAWKYRGQAHPHGAAERLFHGCTVSRSLRQDLADAPEHAADVLPEEFAKPPKRHQRTRSL